MSNLTIKGKLFKGTDDLWNLLTRKNVSYDAIDKNELQKYKTILEMTHSLERIQIWGDIQTSLSIKFKNVIAKLFPEAKDVIQQKCVTF